MSLLSESRAAITAWKGLFTELRAIGYQYETRRVNKAGDLLE